MKHEIYKMSNKTREEIVLAMRRRVERFKEWVTSDRHSEHLACYFIESIKGFEKKYYFIKDKHYGCKDNNYYYWIFPQNVQFIYQKSHWSSNCIFFNDKFKCWFVYDKDKKDYVTFEALDTDSQIAIFMMLDHFIDDEYWKFSY